MRSAVDHLVAYIRARRVELGISQNELARMSGLNPGTLANIMVGRVTKAPSLETLQKLAGGLRVESDFLFRVARGEDAADRSVAPLRPTSGKHPISDEEWEVLERSHLAGLHLDLGRYPDLFDVTPAERTWLFGGLAKLANSIEVNRRKLFKSG